MNKIFKVIWNRTTQSLVVTSELAKGQVKSSSDVSVPTVVCLLYTSDAADD